MHTRLFRDQSNQLNSVEYSVTYYVLRVVENVSVAGHIVQRHICYVHTGTRSLNTVILSLTFSHLNVYITGN
jgi:hypothetical protein